DSMFALELADAIVPALEIGQLPAQLVASSDHIGERRTMLALEPLQQRKPFLDLLQTRGRRFDSLGIAAEKRGEILELRLDAVARVDVGLELRIERCQF